MLVELDEISIHGMLKEKTLRNGLYAYDRIKIGKESDVYLASRHIHNEDWQRAGTRCIHDIDTERSLEDTILSVKKAIWNSL